MQDKSRQAKIKNKNPAPVQVTAEQILREANERQEKPKAKPVVIIADKEELSEYQQDKRKFYEDSIRANRNIIGNWIRYATWEENQGDKERARSVLERAIEVDARNPSVWLRYIELEMKQKNVNSARNVFDRVVSFLPRVDMFWYKYVYMEEILDNVAGARQVFERWMKWEPSEDAWMSYVKFEKRYHEIENSRLVFKRFVQCSPQPKNWIKWAKFEESLSNNDYARKIYEECIDTLSKDKELDQNVYVSFAKFETRMKEYERARGIFKYALEKLSHQQSSNLYNEYTLFEKMFGDKQGIEDVVMTKRRAKYETELQSNPRNYDTWFDYIRLEEDAGTHSQIRDIYERAISFIPLTQEKRFWRRYIYIWLFYAVWEENIAGDSIRAKSIYEKCISIIPHEKFTFGKVWTLYSTFLLRQNNLKDARKVLGLAIGKYPKQKLFKAYIAQELSLREFDRTRTLYERFLAYNPSLCSTWIKFAELELVLGEVERCRGVFEIALEQGELDMPELLWKASIDFEVECGEYDRARLLYERLLMKTEHVKVWISYAGFESSVEQGTKDERAQKSRELFERAYEILKSSGKKEERMVLLEAWKAIEIDYGNSTLIGKVDAKMPRVVKKRRKVDGGVWEEYFDYIFPDDEVDKPNFKLLAMAHEWKMKFAAEKAGEKDTNIADITDESVDNQAA